MKDEEIRELLYQALETELGGVQVYTTALRCVVNDDLKKEWDKYLEQTQNASWRRCSRASVLTRRRRLPVGSWSGTSASRW